MAKSLGLKSPFKDAYSKGDSGSSDVTGAKVVSGDLDVSGAKPVIGFPIGDAPEDLFDCLDAITNQK